MSIASPLYSIVENTTKTNETRFYIYDSLGFCITTNPEFFSTYEEAYKYLNNILQTKLKKIMSKIFTDTSSPLLTDVSEDQIIQDKIINEIYNHKLIFSNQPKPHIKNKY
ncbi:hypothetical protein [Lonsdalea quercina]|uniref:hypothetical protein n=1 Tax=Lonsdalea quercina TaxID=71657 RepID=UPI003974CE1F